MMNYNRQAWHVSPWVREDFHSQKVAERKAARELQTQVEHAEFLAAKYRVTQEQITRVYNDLWKRFADGEFDAPIPFTLRCPTTLADVDDFVDLQDTQREAVS